MRLFHRILFSMVSVVLLVAGGLCVWLLVYTADLPDINHLSDFAPSAPSSVSDSCLASPIVAIPFQHIAKPFQDALAAAEPYGSLPGQIARTLLCDRQERNAKYQLNVLRLSWHIRRRFSEKQLFAIYANRVYFGQGATGIESASRKFFGKGPDTLRPDEAALLAGVIRAPDSLSPFKHPERALQRRNAVLETMVAQGKLSAAARAEAAPILTQSAE